MRNQNQTQTTNTPKTFYSGNYTIINPKWNEQGNVCRFSLRLDDCGVVLYGMRLLYNRQSNEPFFSFPAFKGNDDKYFNYCYCAFSDSVKEKIVSELEAV